VTLWEGGGVWQGAYSPGLYGLFAQPRSETNSGHGWELRHLFHITGVLILVCLKATFQWH